MTASLRTKLFVSLTAVILAAGLLGGAFAYAWGYSEAIELQDSMLLQLGTFAQNDNFKTSKHLAGVDEEAAISVFEMSAPCDPSQDCRFWGFPDGLHEASLDNDPVRLLLATRADGSRVAIAQRTSIREETATGMAVRTLLPIAALVPCLLLITTLVVARSLRPVVRLARHVDLRAADDPTPLPMEAAPTELRPFITSINGLLRRTELMLTRQRQFVADAAHELRSPITALSVQADNLDPIALPAEGRERVMALKDGTRRAKHLLEQLLSLARQQEANRMEFSIVRLDDDTKRIVADLLPTASDRGIDLGFERLEEVAVDGDSFALMTMIRNIVTNAVSYTPQGGHIDVRVFNDTNEAIVQVHDTGPGIPEDDVPRIFEPFFRGRDPGSQGSGLGLAIVKRIAEQHGGSVELKNMGAPAAPGLQVTVRLPRAVNRNHAQT